MAPRPADIVNRGSYWGEVMPLTSKVNASFALPQMKTTINTFNVKSYRDMRTQDVRNDVDIHASISTEARMLQAAITDMHHRPDLYRKLVE